MIRLKIKYITIAFLIFGSFLFGQNERLLKEVKIPSSEVDTNKLYPNYLVENEPCFPGGNDSLRTFFSKYYKRTRMNMEYDGYVCLCLIINRQGKIENYFIPGDSESELFNDVFSELVKKMPIWIPGKIKGIEVKTLICYPFLNLVK